MHHTASERSTKREDLEVSNSNILHQHKQTNTIHKQQQKRGDGVKSIVSQINAYQTTQINSDGQTFSNLSNKTDVL